MPKGKKQFQHTNTPQNGRRAIKGLWGIKGKIKNCDIKEKEKQFNVLNNMCLQKYAIHNIEKNENIQIEMPNTIEPHSQCPYCDYVYTQKQIDMNEVVPCNKCYKCFVGDCENYPCDCEFSDDEDD